MDFFKDIFKDVSYSFNERIRNPYWFSLLILFVFFNWESLFFLLENLFAGAEEGSKNIKSLEFIILKPFFLAFLGVIIFYLIQYFGLGITVIFQDRLKPTILERLSHKRIATADKVIGLRSLITHLSEEKNELESQIGSLKSVYDSQLRDVNGKLIEMDNKVKGQERELAEKTASLHSFEDLKHELESNIEALRKELKGANDELNTEIGKRIFLEEQLEKAKENFKSINVSIDKLGPEYKNRLKVALSDTIRGFVSDKPDLDKKLTDHDMKRIVALSNETINRISLEALVEEGFIFDYSSIIRSLIEELSGIRLSKIAFQDHFRRNWLIK